MWQNRSCWQTFFVRIRFLEAMSPCFNSPRFSIVFQVSFHSFKRNRLSCLQAWHMLNLDRSWVGEASEVWDVMSENVLGNFLRFCYSDFVSLNTYKDLGLNYLFPIARWNRAVWITCPTHYLFVLQVNFRIPHSKNCLLSLVVLLRYTFYTLNPSNYRLTSHWSWHPRLTHRCRSLLKEMG